MASARYKPFSMIEWAVSPGLTPYPEALAFMEARVQAIIEGQQAEMVWLLEHPPFIQQVPVPANTTFWTVGVSLFLRRGVGGL